MAADSPVVNRFVARLGGRGLEYYGVVHARPHTIIHGEDCIALSPQAAKLLARGATNANYEWKDILTWAGKRYGVDAKRHVLEIGEEKDIDVGQEA